MGDVRRAPRKTLGDGESARRFAHSPTPVVIRQQPLDSIAQSGRVQDLAKFLAHHATRSVVLQTNRGQTGGQRLEQR